MSYLLQGLHLKAKYLCNSLDKHNKHIYALNRKSLGNVPRPTNYGYAVITGDNCCINKQTVETRVCITFLRYFSKSIW